MTTLARPSATLDRKGEAEVANALEHTAERQLQHEGQQRQERQAPPPHHEPHALDKPATDITSNTSTSHSRNASEYSLSRVRPSIHTNDSTSSDPESAEKKRPLPFVVAPSHYLRPRSTDHVNVVGGGSKQYQQQNTGGDSIGGAGAVAGSGVGVGAKRRPMSPLDQEQLEGLVSHESQSSNRSGWTNCSFHNAADSVCE